MQAGARLGPYEIISPLGAGGMGEVYRAKDPRLKREVAIKILSPGVLGDEDRQKRFQREAEAISALTHPNILSVFDVGTENGTAYIVSELIEGDSLRKLLIKGPVPIRKLLDIAVQIADGLAAAHQAGIVHRDLKPENIMMTREGRVKILDFGLAKPLLPTSGGPDDKTASAALTDSGIILGTVRYMSPEQASGLPIDFRSDQFSFGLLLYEMATGKQAFVRSTPVQTLSAIVADEAAPIATLNPKVPPPLRWSIERMLAKDPHQRYGATIDLYHELRNLRDHLSEATSTGAMTAAPASKWTPKRILQWALFLLLPAIGFLISAIFFSSKTVDLSSYQPTYHRLTFRRGTIYSARFAPDGQTVVYSAAWDGNPPEIYTSVPGNPEYRSLGLVNANILSISRAGEMAVILNCKNYDPNLGFIGTLARVGLSGGAPRELSEKVMSADWTPDGRNLAAIRLVDNKFRLEFPLGTVLYESSNPIRDVRVSPNQKLIAFLENRQREDTYAIVTVDEKGRRQTLSSGWFFLWGLAWSPLGDEVWVGASKTAGVAKELHAITLSGKERLVFPITSQLSLQDISRGPRVLMSVNNDRAGINVLPPGETKERDLSWFDWSSVRDISKDGKMLLFFEIGEGVGGLKRITYIRKTDGSPAVRLGEGSPCEFSPDGKWVIAISDDSRRLVMIPTGAGTSRTLARGPIDEYRNAAWLPDGSGIVFGGKEKTHGFRIYMQDVAGANPRAITPEGIELPFGHPVSPDGQLVVTDRTLDGEIWLYPLGKGEPRLIPGMEPGENVIRWGADSRMLYVGWPKVFLLDISSGRRQLWKELRPSDPAGVALVWSFQFTPDGKSYAYTYQRNLSELYIVDGIH